MKCKHNGHEIYKRRTDAVRDFKGLVARAKRTGEGGDSWRKLNVFRCPHAPHWHVGRSNLITPAPAPETKSKRLPTLDKIKRKIRMIEREWDASNRRRAAYIAKLIEIDRQLGDIS
jgi:hypothetical protein